MIHHHAAARALVDQLLVALLVLVTFGVVLACIVGASSLAEDPCGLCR